MVSVPRDPWEPAPTELHAKWWEARIARQREIDASITAKADFEYLYDRPYEDRKTVRVPRHRRRGRGRRVRGVPQGLARAAAPQGRHQ